MTTLRTVTKQRFVEHLERSYFTAANFKVSYPADSLIEILVEFIPRPEFMFSVTRSGTTFLTTECPGEHLLSKESNARDDIGECVYAISEWLRRLEEEYRTANPIVDEFELFRQSISERLQQHLHDEHEHFTRSEATELRSKIDELASQLAGLSDKTNDFERRLSTATSELESLKTDLDSVPKGIWYRKASVKALSAIKAVVKSKEARDFALEAVKKFLLEGPK